MHREGHVGAALVVYAPLGFVAVLVGAREAALLGGIASAGLAMAPDVDMRVPVVEHRGTTHTVWFAGVVGLAVGIAGAVYGAQAGLLVAVPGFLFGSLVGTGAVCSHIAADALTPAGVTPFAPLRETHYTWDVTRASNPLSNYVLLGLGVVAAGGALALANGIRGLVGGGGS